MTLVKNVFIFLVFIFGAICGLGTSTALAQDADIERLFQPQIEYPEGVSTDGACVVKFDVSSLGKPVNIVPSCTDPAFDGEAMRVITGSLYKPKTKDGQPIARASAIETLSFSKPEATPAPKPADNEKVHSDLESKVDEVAFRMDTMSCAEAAKKDAKSGGMMRNLGAVAKAAGYGDVAKGLSYYQQADDLIKKFSNEEKNLFEICMRERGHGGADVAAKPVRAISAAQKQAAETTIASPQKEAGTSAVKRVTLRRDGELVSTNKVYIDIDGVKVARIKRKKDVVLEIPEGAQYIRARTNMVKMKKLSLDQVKDGDKLRVKYNELAMRPSRVYVIVHQD